jgi:hypothetical protein
VSVTYPIAVVEFGSRPVMRMLNGTVTFAELPLPAQSGSS